MIGFGCEAKEKLGLSEFSSMIKQRNRAKSIMMVLEDQGKDPMSASFTVEKEVKGGEKETRTYTVSEVLENTQNLESLKARCSECPASCGRYFGCFRAVNFPVSKESEKWLIGLAKNAISDGGDAKVFVESLLSQNFTGNRFKRLRESKPGFFFECEKALSASFEDGRTVTSDQILEALVGMAEMKKPHMLLSLFFSGGLKVLDDEPAPGEYDQFVKASSEGNKDKWLVFSLPGEDGDDESIAELKVFFYVMFTSFALGSNIVLKF